MRHGTAQALGPNGTKPNMNNIQHFQHTLANTRKFVCSQIGLNAEYYLSSYLDVLGLSALEADLDALETRAKAEYVYWRDLASIKREWFSDERRYRMLAYEHAFDIIDSIRKRFGDGN